jgi:hypothetical protein
VLKNKNKEICKLSFSGSTKILEFYFILKKLVSFLRASFKTKLLVFNLLKKTVKLLIGLTKKTQKQQNRNLQI